jgi:hypothetical protein
MSRIPTRRAGICPRISLPHRRSGFAVVFLVAVAMASNASGQTTVVFPYVQPGDQVAKEGHDTKTLHCWTDPTPGEFSVEFFLPDGSSCKATPSRIALDFEALKPCETEWIVEKCIAGGSSSSRASATPTK